MIEKMTLLYILALIAFIAALVINDGIVWMVFLVGIIVLALINAGYSWYVKTYIKRYYYAGEEHFITIKKGVFAPTEIHVQWQKIQDVYVDQDILDRIMGLYDVHIASATATSGIEAHIDGVDQRAAEGLKKFFLDKMTAKSGVNNVQNPTTPEGQVAQATQPAVTKINLTEDMSSNSYPLSDKWTIVALLGRVISAFLLSAIIVFFVFGKSKDASFSDNLSYYIMGFVALGIVIALWRTITLFLWKKNYAFKFNPDNIYFKEGVFSLSEKHMPYSSIQDVTVNQGVIDRLVGLANVRIENAATQSVMTKNGPKPVFTGVIIQGLSLADAKKITDLLKTTVLGKNTGKYGL